MAISPASQFRDFINRVKRRFAMQIDITYLFTGHGRRVISRRWLKMENSGGKSHIIIEANASSFICA